MDEYSGALKILAQIRNNSAIVDKATNSLILFGVISDKSQFPDFDSEIASCDDELIVEDAIQEKKRRLNPSSV